MIQVGRGSLVLVLILGLILSHFPMAFAEEFRYDSHGHRDPFVPVLKANTSAKLGHTEFHLQGIVIDPNGGSFAVVNGQVLREGDEFEGFFLKKIESNRVLFENEGAGFEVILNEDEEEAGKDLRSEKSAASKTGSLKGDFN